METEVQRELRGNGVANESADPGATGDERVNPSAQASIVAQPSAVYKNHEEQRGPRTKLVGGSAAVAATRNAEVGQAAGSKSTGSSCSRSSCWLLAWKRPACRPCQRKCKPGY